MGHNSVSVKKASKSTALERHNRVQQRSTKRKRCLEEEFRRRSSIEDENNLAFLLPDDEINYEEPNDDNTTSTQTNKVETHDMGCQTLLTNDDIELLLLNNKEEKKFCSEEYLKDNNDKVQFYTGLEAFSVLVVIYNLVSPGLPKRECLTKFQQLVLTLMRLRLNLPVQDLAYRLGVHASTISRTFHTCIETMFSSMQFLVHWPDRENLLLTMPMCFRENFPSCAVIIDCFEVFIDRPSDLLARSQTWSSYKHHNTAKFLIGITPQGTVSFISKGWGGRVSDKFITDHCGLLKKLLPGDLVLADRGFDIADSCGLHGARLKIPAFTKGKPQLSPVDIETTRKIANVRIHVERVIGSVRQKYTILGHGVLPIQYLMGENDEPCLLDKIAFLCCALTNCCKSVISPE